MTRSLLLAALGLLVAGCHDAPLPLAPDAPAQQASLCTIEPETATPPDDPLLDLRLEVVQRCAYCPTATVAVAEIFPAAPRTPPVTGRWLASLAIDYGTRTLDRCDILQAGIPYPALLTFVDLDGNGRCDPGVDRVGLDERYTWGFRDEVVHVDLLDSPSTGVATVETCALLPPR